MGKKELNPRQKRFAEEYLLCGDAEEAALAAGYSPAAAARTGERLLRDPAVQAYRREAEQRLYEAIGVTPAWIGRRLVEIADRCMQAVPHYARNPETKQREPDGTWEFDPGGALRALHELAGFIRGQEEPEEDAGETPSFESWLAGQESESRL